MTKSELRRILDDNGHKLVYHMIMTKAVESTLKLKDGDRIVRVHISRASHASKDGSA